MHAHTGLPLHSHDTLTQMLPNMLFFIRSGIRLLIAFRISFLQPRQERSDHLQSHSFSFTFQRIIDWHPRFKTLFRNHITVIEGLENALNQTCKKKKFFNVKLSFFFVVLLIISYDNLWDVGAVWLKSELQKAVEAHDQQYYQRTALTLPSSVSRQCWSVYCLYHVLEIKTF